MAFRLRKDAEKWFSELQGRTPFKTMWDMYYFCVMAGFASGRKTDPVSGGRSAPEFVDYVVDDYRPAQRLLIGLLIVSELKKLDISFAEKKDVQNVIQSIVDPQTQTSLKPEGQRLMNAYASGGYDFLAEKRPTKPYRTVEFLRDYNQLLSEFLTDNPFWPVARN
jgi:hypothetical protein